MEVNIVTSALVTTKTIDSFGSLIWTDRFFESGDFELAISPTTQNLYFLSNGTYLTTSVSSHWMVIEDLLPETDPVDGNRFMVKGRSLESILDRRIVWKKTSLKGNFQTLLKSLITSCAINPSNADRRISRLDFIDSVDPVITALTIDTEVEEGVNLYRAVHDLCFSRDIGFKIIPNALGRFEFMLYSGVDRSYNQVLNPYVVCSPESGTLVSSSNLRSSRLKKTVGLVAGEEGVANTRRTVTVTAPGGGLTDLDRREIYIDARGITRSVPDNPPLSDAEYDAKLTEKGTDELAKNVDINTLESQIDPLMLRYGIDFLLGDIVQLLDDFGNESQSRVVEIIHSHDSSGYSVYPTFSAT